jgi:prolyl oligopeptidase
VLLSGYGGFNVSRTPAFDPGNFPFLDRGGLFAPRQPARRRRLRRSVAPRRHAREEAERLRRLHRGAEFLISQGYTAPGRIAIEGGSNGGLLVGAALIQRPDLFGAVLCRVPVADMLRYHLFTVGRFWIPSTARRTIRRSSRSCSKYSPYHNVAAASVSADAGHDGGHRRPRRSRHGEEVRGAAPGRGRRRADPDPRGDEGRHGAGKPIAK